MAEVHIFADTKGKGHCRSCQADIEWAENAKTGKRTPFNGDIVAVRTYHDPADHRLIEVLDSTVTVNHFVTCPQSREWRKK